MNDVLGKCNTNFSKVLNNRKYETVLKVIIFIITIINNVNFLWKKGNLSKYKLIHN